jgi:hypothetical protein
VRALAAALLFAALGCAGAPASEAGPAGAERLYRSKCSACHRAYAPTSRDRAAWGQVFPKMAVRARLSDDERARILEFLETNARDAAPGAHP